MKAHILKKLHDRQYLVLDMIIDCDERISEKERELKKALANDTYSYNYTDWITDRNKRNKAIRLRLIEYYKDIQIRIMTLQPEIELTTSTEMDMATTLS